MQSKIKVVLLHAIELGDLGLRHWTLKTEKKLFKCFRNKIYPDLTLDLQTYALLYKGLEIRVYESLINIQILIAVIVKNSRKSGRSSNTEYVICINDNVMYFIYYKIGVGVLIK